MDTRNYISFKVRVKGNHHSWFSECDWSGYNERWKKYHLDEKEPVYGLEQALEHIKELREHVYNGEKIYSKLEMEVVLVNTIETVIKTV